MTKLWSYFTVFCAFGEPQAFTLRFATHLSPNQITAPTTISAPPT